ncbi:MAG: hypothetical protein R3348_05980, partial [Xanthomonadales bacterium]|nr:hypothetical protein [Xanthomonadales bacterium]
PDFQAPIDADGDNTYEVTLGVSDGNGGEDTLAVDVIITGVTWAGSFRSATVAATGKPKQVQFEWTYEGRADQFILEANPDDVSGYAQVDLNGDGLVDDADQLDSSQSSLAFSIALHLTDFTSASYRIVARDDTDAEIARSSDIGLDTLVVEDLVGRLDDGISELTYYGYSVATSADGNTVVIGAMLGNLDNGEAYLFERENGSWNNPIRLMATHGNTTDRFGVSVDISADGSTVVVGADREDSNATGINGSGGDNSANDAGAAYVFQLGSDGAWSQTDYLKASNTDPGDKFGTEVRISGDGNTIAVGAPGEASSALTIDGNETDNAVVGSGAVYVFTRTTESWEQQAYLKSEINTASVGYAIQNTLAISADGDTIAAGALHVQDVGTVQVFNRSELGEWTVGERVAPDVLDNYDNFGYSVALSADGDRLAVGAIQEDGYGDPVGADATDNSGTGVGAAYVFMHSGSGWTQAAYLKAINGEDTDNFGANLEFSDDGRILAVASFAEDSLQTGVNADGSDNSRTERGAVYVFSEDDGGSWQHRSYVKPPHADLLSWPERFGRGLALDGDGDKLFVGSRTLGEVFTY